MTTKTTKEELARLRSSIDKTDDALLALIHERVNLAQEIGEVKR